MTSNCTASGAQVQLELGIEITKPSKKARSGSGLVLFRPYQTRQLGLFPAKLEELLPDDHLVFFIQAAVSRMDLSKILCKYKGKSGLGRHGFDPRLMVTLIVYCYCCGATSSREIERLATENIPCRIITGNQPPEHETINSFRQMHLQELGALYRQTLNLADKVGLVDLDKVAVDGSKVKAFASKRKSMSYERMCKKLIEMPKEINELKDKLSKLEGKDDLMSQRKREGLQNDIAFQEKRLARIKGHKRGLEKRVREAGGGRPEPKAQINFTDPESNIMHSVDRFEKPRISSAVATY